MDSYCRVDPQNQGKFLNLDEFHFYFLEVLKALLRYVLQVILNAWFLGLMQKNVVNFYKFLYHMIHIVIFRVKSCPDSYFILLILQIVKLVPTLT